MKRKSLPVGILALALMVMLGSIGVVYGYTAWSQRFDVIGSVTTATFDVHWGTLDATKNVGCGEITRNKSSNPDSDQLLVAAFKDIKPGFDCHFEAPIVNDSTIPVTITGVVNSAFELPSTGTDAAWLISSTSIKNGDPIDAKSTKVATFGLKAIDTLVTTGYPEAAWAIGFAVGQ
jgi:hypothetical protein